MKAVLLAVAKIVIDHVAGSRRGQRQEFAPDPTICFGRHPDSDVSFDAQRDLDASTRHAEMTLTDGRYVLRDVGSSNGTWVDGQRISELTLPADEAVEVEFGSGGPKLRIFLMGDSDKRAPSAIINTRARSRPVVLVALCVAVAVGAVLAWELMS